VLRFPQADLPDVVYLEHLTSALYLDKRDDLDAYTQVLDSLTVSAPPPREAEEQIAAILEQLG
jgi:hypothetical protein